jgi:hypothetical protein
MNANAYYNLGLALHEPTTLDDYISLAVHLGQDSEWRKRISEKIAANKHLIYRDRTCIAALENFLETAVKERLK